MMDERDIHKHTQIQSQQVLNDEQKGYTYIHIYTYTYGVNHIQRRMANKKYIRSYMEKY